MHILEILYDTTFVTQDKVYCPAVSPMSSGRLIVENQENRRKKKLARIGNMMSVINKYRL